MLVRLKEESGLLAGTNRGAAIPATGSSSRTRCSLRPHQGGSSGEFRSV